MKTTYLYFEGGLGDVINDIYSNDKYTYLSRLTTHEQVVIALACHNPFAHELFTFHRRSSQFDIRFAPHHIARACELKLDDLARREYICEAVNVPLEQLYKASQRHPDDPVELPSIDPIYPYSDVKNVLIVLDTAVAWKSVPYNRWLEGILPVIKNHSNIQFHLLTRPYNKTFSDDLTWPGYHLTHYANSNISNLSLISPTVPDTLRFASQVDLILTPHSCLAQHAGYTDVPCIVFYPDAWADFAPPKFGTHHTKHFLKPNFSLIPFSLMTPDIINDNLTKRLYRPF